MRKPNPWAALFFAVPLLLTTATSSFSATQDKPAATQEQAVAAPASAEPGDAPEDVSVILNLEDGSSITDPAYDPEPEPSAKPHTPTPAAALEITSRVKDIAVKYLGTPYRWGGTTPAAFDCSGFTKYVLNSLGVHLPRTAREQFKAGVPVKRDELQAGDLVFFDMRKGYVSHVGLYIGDGMFIHASTPATGVKTDKLDTQTYRKCFVGARRFGCA